MSDMSAVMEVSGTPGSPGRATGPARVVHGPDDFARVRPGDVLVCRFTEPAWTALFGVVAAVVTETGGVLSHAAIVAREYGIPAVLAVPGATTTLPDGATVTVDGGTGRVTA
jgi:pyruvate,water dikinase